MDKRDLERLQREELRDHFINKDVSSLGAPLPENPQFEKLINDCPFCGEAVRFFDTANNLLMNGTWHIDCSDCDLTMREDFIIGKDKGKAENIILKRWNKRK